MKTRKFLQLLVARAAALVTDRRANFAMTFALSLLPVAIAAGTGLDLARAMIVRGRLSEALDAAGLAVGGSSGLSQADMQALATKYFKANYHIDEDAFGTPADVTVTPNGQSVTLSTHVDVPTVLVRLADIVSNSHNFDKMTVGATSQVVWGQTKLWVSLVLDNTGSMSETDKTGTSKMSALITATHQLLTTLKNAATNAGDVQVAIVPFSKTVNVGATSANLTATWIDWTDWDSAPPSSTPTSDVGPGSDCPYSTSKSPYGYSCTVAPANASSTTSTIPAVTVWSSSTSYSSGDQVSYNGSYYVSTKSGSNHSPSGSSSYWDTQAANYNGYICPSVDNGKYNTGKSGHYYNGCYTSVPSSKTTTTTCTTVGNGNASCKSSTANGTYTGSTSAQTCTSTKKNGTTTTVCTTKSGAPYTHNWVSNAHSTWGGCIMDRTQDYDTKNTTPSGSSTKFPTENSQSCVPSKLGTLSYDWTSLNNQVDAMSAGGSTNQAVGLAWGWQALTQGVPLSAAALPDNTSQVIILLSDGLNTQDRWYGNGSDQSSDVDTRTKAACDNVKAANITIYTVFVDLGGTSGSKSVMQYCATDPGKYFDLTTSGSIITAFQAIAEQITNLRVAL
ncbi:MAG TPA: pilus assembly protein TadG-related protein [Rhizomicrobium sp.]|jgi:Flp pilus assembly protein TadG|nr:pilus assembly protein TadG-related protein [Rhizomicrobium sp.]